MNNTERAQWIDKDEGLHNWWFLSGKSKGVFIRENKDDLDKAIKKVILARNRVIILKEVRRLTRRK
jgi:hypothetical protein